MELLWEDSRGNYWTWRLGWNLIETIHCQAGYKSLNLLNKEWMSKNNRTWQHAWNRRRLNFCRRKTGGFRPRFSPASPTNSRRRLNVGLASGQPASVLSLLDDPYTIRILDPVNYQISFFFGHQLLKVAWNSEALELSKPIKLMCRNILKNLKYVNLPISHTC